MATSRESASSVDMMSSPQRDAPARTLADQLRRWPDSRLANLLRERPDLATPIPHDCAQLASKAASHDSIQHALDKLTRLELSVLDALLVAGQTRSAQAMSLVNAEPEATEVALLRLLDLALIWEAPNGLRALSGTADALAARPGASGVRPCSPQPQSTEALAQLIADLPPAARAMLEHVDLHGGQANTATARRTVSVADARSPAEDLIARGLLVPREAGSVILPGEVALALRGGQTTRDRVDVVPEVATSERDPALIERAAGGAAFEAVRRVELLLDGWGVSPPGVLRGGGLSVRDLKATAATLHVDLTTATLLIEVSAQAGLLAEGADSDGDLRWLPTDAFDIWTTRPSAEQWLALAAAWLSSNRVPSLVGQRDAGTRSTNALAADLSSAYAVDARELTLQILATLPSGQTLATGTGIASVVTRAKWVRPRRPTVYPDLIAATIAEAATLGILGAGGLSEAGRQLADGNLTEASNALAPRLPQPVEHVLLQADLTAIAPGPLDSEVAKPLHLLADVESRGGASVHRFTRDSIRRAFDAGWAAAQVHDFLASISQTPVPQPLTYLVDDVARTFGTIRLGHAEAFLRADDEAALAALVHDPRASTLGLRLLAPTVVISSTPLEVLLPRLRELGAAPVVEGPDGTVRVVRPDLKRAQQKVDRRRAPGAVAARQESQVQAAVTAIRAGDLTRASRPSGTGASTRPAEVLASLREAIETQASVVITYAGSDGATLERVVEPTRLTGGRLTALDHRSESTLEFAVHRIASVVALDPDEAGRPRRLTQ